MIHSLDTSYEQAEREMLLSLAKPGDVLFDVGAYVGWYSVAFARSVPESKVYAFEPIPEIRRELMRNVKDLPNIICPVSGLSDKAGVVDFYVSEREPGGTASMAPLEEDRFGPSFPVRCVVNTIDSLCDTLFPPPNIIKIDVEGAELLVLKGGQQTIEKHRPIILCEMLRKWSKRFGYHPNDLIAYMKGFDYECRTIDGGLFTVMTDDTVERNFFFFPKSLSSI